MSFWQSRSPIRMWRLRNAAGSMTISRYGEDDRVFVVSKDHVHKVGDRYSVVVLPEKEYTVLPMDWRRNRQTPLTEQISRITGKALALDLAARSMGKAEQTAGAPARTIGEQIPVIRTQAL